MFEINGYEASLVIIYDFDWFSYEAFTRAKHNLIIVTISPENNEPRRVRFGPILHEQYVILNLRLKYILQEICDGRHTNTRCSEYKRIHKEKFGIEPQQCKFYGFRCHDQIPKLIEKVELPIECKIPWDSSKIDDSSDIETESSDIDLISWSDISE